MRVEQVVVNASPLICLFRAGLEGVLRSLWPTVVVPDAVRTSEGTFVQKSIAPLAIHVDVQHLHGTHGTLRPH